MVYKLHTSAATQEIYGKLFQSTGLQPFILSKIAIALSLRYGDLTDEDFQTDGNGLELNRQTIFGETDLIFRCLIAQNEKRALTDEEYFPRIVKAHLDRGARLLGEESRYNRNFYANLCQLDTNL